MLVSKKYNNVHILRIVVLVAIRNDHNIDKTFTSILNSKFMKWKKTTPHHSTSKKQHQSLATKLDVLQILKDI